MPVHLQLARASIPQLRSRLAQVLNSKRPPIRTRSVQTYSRQSPTMASHTADREKEIQRNPHGDFKAVEASRPTWAKNDFHYTQTAKPDWTPGSGANTPSTAQHRS